VPRITHIETIKVLVPIRPLLVIQSSQGPHSASPFLLVKLHTEDGNIGIGEASCTLLWSGEDHHNAAHCIQHCIAPAIVGMEITDFSALFSSIEMAVQGMPFTKSAVQMAVWDAYAKHYDQPLWQILGALGILDTKVPIKFSISGTSPSRAAEIAHFALNHGFQTMKVKVGIPSSEGKRWQHDLDRVMAVREAVGPEVMLGVDANGGWTAEEAVPAIKDLMEAANISFVEQPVPGPDHAGMHQVRKQTGLPVIADESLFEPHHADALTEARAADIFSVYVGKSGGIQGALQMSAVGRATGIHTLLGSNLELGVGSAAMLHTAIAARSQGSTLFASDIIGPLYYETELISTPINIADGYASLPETGLPGLGIRLNDEAVKRFQVS
jgi:L-alanine-DL-glutamate epimerase-like enolase superfamily enzyme